ncbi:MAG: riboflavin synthase, partial [Candidatus Poseidonia sp.]|nr:riboflavin synthase [Poseidonia sp.]
MFTGIVQGLGQVVRLDRDDVVWTFHIRLPNVEGLQIGASVAINGTCLT